MNQPRPSYSVGRLLGKLDAQLLLVLPHPPHSVPCNSDHHPGVMVILVTHPSYSCLSYCRLHNLSCQTHPSLPYHTYSGKVVQMGHLSVHHGLTLASGQSQPPSSHGILGSSGHCNVCWAPADLMPLFVTNERMKRYSHNYGYMQGLQGHKYHKNKNENKDFEESVENEHHMVYKFTINLYCRNNYILTCDGKLARC